MLFGLFVQVFVGVLVRREECHPSSMHAACPVDEQVCPQQCNVLLQWALFPPQLVSREAGKWTARRLSCPVPWSHAGGSPRGACVRLWGVLGIPACG